MPLKYNIMVGLAPNHNLLKFTRFPGKMGSISLMIAANKICWFSELK